ncbi:hypothetical protein [Paenisporosarcina sp. TG-14]|uniref:hypothetical protein n=1 Tax=Paenisporosarcina sp. TG-14 TaxID=1231057 RepID=UPI0003624CB8|nr:hypothetical protein [Paenisporosarcina sp. TG-14]
MVTIQGFPLCFAEELNGFGSATLLLKEEIAKECFTSKSTWLVRRFLMVSFDGEKFIGQTRGFIDHIRDLSANYVSPPS